MIKLFSPFMSNDAISISTDTMKSGMITQGPKVELFEKKLSEFFNHPYVCTVNSCTSALFIALKMCDLKKDDEVLTSPLTCFASTSAILANNYNIKWIDVDKNNCNISLDDLQKNINEKTRVILYVLWAGTPINLDQLYIIKNNAEKKYGHPIHIIHDAAHAFGATFNNKYIGSDSNGFACYSFQAIKHLTCIDGGALLCPSKEYYERAKLLRWYGISRDDNMLISRIEQNVVESGFKMHMNDVSASIGLGNLDGAIKNVIKNREIAYIYNNSLKNLNHVKLLPFNKESSYWIYTLLVDDIKSFSKFMKSKQITVNQVHTRNDNHLCVQQFKSRTLPNLDYIVNSFISIPCGSWWLSKENVNYIITSIKEWNMEYSNDFKIRLLNENDKEKYLHLLKQLTHHNYTCSDNDFKNKLNEMKDSSIYILEKNNVFVSTAKIFIEKKFGDSVAHIEDVVTDFDFRGLGYGKKLLEYCIQDVKKFPIYKIVLGTNISDFYNKCGFNSDGIHMSLRI